MRSVVCALLGVFLITSMASADDVFKVEISNQHDLLTIQRSGVRPLARLHDGYLVLADQSSSERLTSGELTWSLVSVDVAVEQLAIDGRRDNVNADRYPILYADGNFRLLQVDFTNPANRADLSQAYPVNLSSVNWAIEKAPLPRSTTTMAEDLGTLIAKVDRDSLYSYVERL